MPIKRLTVVVALASALLSGSLCAQDASHVSSGMAAALPAINPAAMMTMAPAYAGGLIACNLKAIPGDASASLDVSPVGSVQAQIASAADAVVTTTPEAGNDDAPADRIDDLRKALITLAMQLRDIRYVRGGRDPSTGFDCSGFVRYVFAHAVGIQLPTNSASQFLAGLKVKRADMKPGDLVFFHTRGRRGISHVGIYISNGEFIHSPASGKSVEISSLDEAYWAKHFVGAKRPDAIAMASEHNG